jgi:sugar transferase (PEP-CTERM/EpsH1 system associated)
MHILWLKTELLHPLDKGGRIRSYQLLRHLRQRHAITYLSLDDGAAGAVERAAASEYCDRLVCIPFAPPPKQSPRMLMAAAASALDELPYAISRYRSRAMEQAVRDLVARSAVDLVVADFLVSTINLPPSLPVPAVLFQHNVEAQIWARRAQHAPALLRWFIRDQADKMRRYERAACRRADHIFVVSDADRRTHEVEYGVAAPTVIDTGVDVAQFSSHAVTPERNHIAFVGSMDWQPNEDAVVHFVEAILPRLRERRPEAIFTIVGRNPSLRLRALAGKDERIIVTGRVPDVRPYIGSAAATVVPLRIGGGTRLKILESMAMGRPVVSTTIGAEGLNLANGDGLVIADDPVSFAAATARLLADEEYAQRMRQRARAVACVHAWPSAAACFENALERVRPRSWPVEATG